MSAQTTQERPPIEEMAAVHRVFRREFRMLPELVRAVPAGDTGRARVIADHTRLILSMLHMHHSGEDALLWPLLLERAKPARDLVERMQAQHANVDKLINRLGPILDRFATTAGGGDELAGTLEELRVVLVDHLNLEEAQVVPLAEQHLSASEWNRMGQRGVREVRRRELPLVFCAVLEEADEKEREILLNVLPAPARVAVTTVGAVHYRRYISRVRQGRAD
jgi:hypothetical protein